MARSNFNWLNIILVTSANFGVAEAVVRKDLSAPLGKLFCEDGARSHPLAAWEYGIFDAQIQGKLIKVNDQSKTLKIQKNVAKSLNRQSFHRATAYGECSPGRVWAASVPSSKPMVELSDGRLRMDGQNLKDACRRFKVEYAPADIGKGRTLILEKNPKTSKDLFVNLKFLEKGTVSVSCYPRKPRWAGPVLWYLYPTKGGPSPDVPAHELLTQTAALDDLLVNWVNALRLLHDLKPLTPGEGSVFSKVLADFSKSKSVAHNRKKISKAKSELKKAGYRFVGENRARGFDQKDLAWLMWNSPSHRKLLLNKDARHLNLVAKKEGGELFAVLLLTRGPS